MTFNEDSNILFLHGGKNSNLKYFLDDLFILDLVSFNWQMISISNEQPLNRCEHNAVIVSDELIIFGGIGEDRFLGSELYHICLGRNTNIDPSSSTNNK